MRVIILSGETNCGKTTSLKKLFERIKETSDVKLLNGEGDHLDDHNEDFCYRLQYPDGKKLAIVTQGDYQNVLEYHYDRFKDCDILVCACNKKFMGGRKEKPFDKVSDYDPLTTIVLKKKYKSVTEEEKKVCAEANEACAEYLFALVELIRKQIK